MEAKITKTENGIDIDVTELEGKETQLLEAFQECSEGRCTCPTEEYKKVAVMTVTNQDDLIQLSIQAKEDETIDTSEIEKCLDYTKKRVAE